LAAHSLCNPKLEQSDKVRFSLPTEKVLVFTAFALMCVASARAQEPRPSAAVDRSGSNLPAQRIGRNDLLAVSIYDAPELSRTYRVGSNGKLKIPMLQTRIDAEGLLPSDLEEQIASALEKEKIMVHAVVTVTVAEYESRPISVSGAVKNPTTFQAIGTIRLLDAIARAGGLSPEVGDSVLLTARAEGSNAAPLTTRIPIKKLIDEADPDLNVRLTGGEEIRVPEAGKIFIVGNVKKRRISGERQE
jgi:polysaccharide export outer membrane protein